MFTGIIEEIGEIKRTKKVHSKLSLDIALGNSTQDLNVGESIAVNGVCLTAVSIGPGSFTAEAVDETIRTTNIGSLRIGSKINIERAVKPETRLGGHIVSGHIDGVGYIKKKITKKDSCEITISFPEELRRYLVKKGSVAIDGVSLTIADVYGYSIKIAVIPHTLKVTTLGLRRVGDSVNIEVDIVGKYIEKAVELKEDAKSYKRMLKPALF